MPRGSTQISPGSSSIDAHLGDEAHAALLRHDQQLAIGIEEMVVDHRAVGDIDMRRHADLAEHVAGRGHGAHAGDEVGRLRRDRHRVPAQLAERQFVVADIRRALPQADNRRRGSGRCA